MRFDVITLFPELVASVTQWGIPRRAVEAGQLDLRTWNPRDWASGVHQAVDDRPMAAAPAWSCRCPR